MLRKLFIGLLILSALTSKGAANEIANASEGVSQGSLSSLCGDKWLAEAETTGTREVSLTGSIPGFSGTVLAAFTGFYRVKSLEQHIYSAAANDLSYEGQWLFSDCVNDLSSRCHESVIYGGTDVSPPSL